MSIRKGFPLLVLSVLLVATPLLALDQVPLKNWTVPGAGRYSTLADVGSPAIFVAMTPCRIADTRSGSGFGGAYGAPSIAGGATARAFPLQTSGCTGIPVGITSYSLNFTVIATGAPLGSFITAFPTGTTMPTVSTLNFGGTGGTQVIANAAVVPAGNAAGNPISVFANNSTDLIIDINGYYIGGSASLNTGERLYVTGDANGLGMIKATNNNTSGGYGILGESYGAAGGIGVYGWAGATSTTGATYGVYGYTGGTTKGAAGVYGYAASSTAITSGVLGVSGDTTVDSAGVMGRDSTSLPAFTNIITSAGVRGESTNNGVIGLSGPAGRGVTGLLLTAGGGLGPFGCLGCATSYGVYAYGNMGASGTKPFVEPHPYKAGTVIRYVALEGPEAGTYFRGRGHFVDGRAVIDVPESFRLVTDEEGITVQITPIGRLASVAVGRIGLDTIDVMSTAKDVEFSYLVQGIRKTFKDWQVEVATDEYMPRDARSTIPSYFSEGQKRNLIQAGVYNEDGTPNLATARRLGWDKVWEAQATTRTR